MGVRVGDSPSSAVSTVPSHMAAAPIKKLLQNLKGI
jgi:hypothetical protein